MKHLCLEFQGIQVIVQLVMEFAAVVGEIRARHPPAIRHQCNGDAVLYSIQRNINAFLQRRILRLGGLPYTCKPIDAIHGFFTQLTQLTGQQTLPSMALSGEPYKVFHAEAI